jgi:hypothetical protein
MRSAIISGGFARAHPRLATNACFAGFTRLGIILVRSAHPRLITNACLAGSNAVGGNLDVVGFARARSRLHRAAPFGGLVGFCLPHLRRLIHGNGVGHWGWKVVPHIRKPKMDDAVVGHLSLSCRGAGVCLLRQQQEWIFTSVQTRLISARVPSTTAARVEPRRGPFLRT